MKKNLILAFLLMWFVGVNLIANAADNASATFTGTLASYYFVQKKTDGTATILDNGDLSSVTNASFTVRTNNTAGCFGTLTMAQVAGTATMAQQSSTVYVALTTTGATKPQIDDALGATPSISGNANVIAYTITCSSAGTGATAFTWNTSNLKGRVTNTAEECVVTVNISGSARGNTFGANDPTGSYLATMTLTASAS